MTLRNKLIERTSISQEKKLSQFLNEETITIHTLSAQFSMRYFPPAPASNFSYGFSPITEGYTHKEYGRDADNIDVRCQ